MPARAMGRQRTPLPCPATQGTAPQTSAPTRAPIPRAYGGCDALPSVLPLTSPNSSPSHMCPNALPSDQPPFYPTTLTHTRIYISTMPRRTDSDRHVPRNDSYMAFHGSGGTNAAHKMSWEVYNGVGAHMGGRPATQHEPIARAMGARSNLREKTEYGNKTLDARRDHRIIDAVASGGGLYEDTTARRANIAYRAGMAGDPTMQARAEIIGNLPVRTGGVGRPTLVKNYQPS